MESSFFGRNEAPIAPETWAVIDNTMIGAAKSQLAGRRLLTIEGPFGFGLKVIPVGDVEMGEGVAGSNFVPVTRIEQSFRLGKRDLAAFERDHVTLDTGAVACAAIRCAALEEKIIFSGLPGIPGLMSSECSSSQTLTKWEKIGTAADQIIDAVTKLDDAGFHGPYCMALAPAQYNLLYRRFPQGDGTELDHLRGIVTDGVVKAPALKKGGVLLASGQQYASLVIGQDMTVGCNGPSGDSLDFFVTESLALLIKAPEAICVLK
ncbi:MAG: hypothetical protein METHP_01215 [Methanoregula sp. SKADARSKE-2]|nr:MAG: hypothetical protein METHP_01215 [Methanoregula sp. SKADARSKE-2]